MGRGHCVQNADRGTVLLLPPQVDGGAGFILSPVPDGLTLVWWSQAFI